MIRSLFNLTSFLIITQKLIQAIAGLATSILVTFYLSPNEQGYFYTMGSLISSYVLLDLGLSGLVLQKSASYFSDLKWSNNNLIIGNKLIKAKFISFSKWVKNWYKKISILSLILFPIGYLFFLYSEDAHGVDWKLPWLIVVLIYALAMPSIGFLSLMEGAQKIRVVYQFRILYILLGGFISWILLIFGNGIYALAAIPFSIIIFSNLWVKKSFKNFTANITKRHNSFSWRAEIYPQQKKVAIFGLSNYLYLHTPVPIIFYFLGPIDAGKFGLSLTIANICISIAMAPITSITPRISSLISQNEYNRAAFLFIKAFILSLFLIIFGTCLFFLVHSLFDNYHFFQRLLAPSQLLLIFISFSFYYFVISFTVYFRAYGKEPFALIQLCTTILIITFGSYLIKSFGIDSFILLVIISFMFLFIYCLIYFLNFVKGLNK